MVLNVAMRYFECHPLPVCQGPSTENGVSGGGGVAEVPMSVNMFRGDSRRVHLEDFCFRNVRVDLLPSVKPLTGNHVNICRFLFHDVSRRGVYMVRTNPHTYARTHART